MPFANRAAHKAYVVPGVACWLACSIGSILPLFRPPDLGRARKSRDFARAGEIRKELAAGGVILEDTKEGVRWKRA